MRELFIRDISAQLQGFMSHMGIVSFIKPHKRNLDKSWF